MGGGVHIVSPFNIFVMKKRISLLSGIILLLCLGYFAHATDTACYDGCIAIGDPFGICIDDAYGPLECRIVSAFQDCTELREIPCRDGIPQ